MSPLLLLALAVAPRLSAAPARRPNVVFVDICSARADHMGVYGYSRDTTPRLDRIARGAAVFENAVAQSSWCLPNYASLFTGQRPENHGLYTNVPTGIPPLETTLAEKLKEGGYETAAFSGGVYEIPEWGLGRGFDTYVNIFSTMTPGRVPAPVQDNMDAVVSWMKRRREDRPFFLYLAVDNLHLPYRLENAAAYDPGAAALDARVFSVPFNRAYNGEAAGYPPELKALAAEFKKDPRNLKRYVARYDAAVNDVDTQVALLVDRLKALGLYDDTVLVITGDHGEMLGEHGLMGHTQGLYQPVLHVPLIVRDPRHPGSFGRRYDQLVERVDMMPTILSMASIGYDELRLPGTSILSLLENPATPWRRYAFAASHRDLAEPGPPILEERVARDERWKLVDYLYRGRFELYDLTKDPAETRDLSASRPDVAQRLAFQMLENLERTRPHVPALPLPPEPAPPLLRDSRKD